MPALRKGCEMKQLTVFDYHTLDIETREFVLCKERTIKARVAHAIIETGNDLISVKERLPHGSFTSWAGSAFGMSRERAAEYMRIASAFKSADSAHLENFSKTALLLLSSGDIPEPIRDEALELAAGGEFIDADTVRELKEKLESLENEKSLLEYKLSHADVENSLALKEKADRLESDKALIEQKYLESEKDRDFLRDEYERRIAFLEDSKSGLESEIEELKEDLDSYESGDDPDCVSCKAAHPHCFCCCLECRNKCNAEQVCRKPVKVIHKTVEVPGPEKIVEKIPEDYNDFRVKAQTLLHEVDKYRSELDRERTQTDWLRRESGIKEASAKIEVGIGILTEVIRMEVPDTWEIPLDLQRKISEIVRCFSSFCAVEDGVSDQSSREKLFRAGYTILRPDEDGIRIRKYSGTGVWKSHSKHETKKAMRNELSRLLKDEKTVLA